MNILLTGGQGGIGSAIASKFIKEGHIIYSIDLINVDLGPNFHNLYGDVTNFDSLVKVKESIKDIKFSTIITLAGRALEDEWKPFKDTSFTSIRDSVNLNLVGHLNVVRMFFDQLDGDKSIILVSSINAYGGFGLPCYSAAKAGLIGFMETVKDEFLKDGVRINVIAPGTILTPATEKEPKDFDALLKGTKLGRFATKEEVADLAYELTFKSEETGKVKIIDAGQLEVKKNVII